MDGYASAAVAGQGGSSRPVDEAEIRAILADAVSEPNETETLFTALLDRFGDRRRPAKMLRSTHRDSYRHLPRHHPRWPGPRPECRWRRSAHGCQRRVDLGAERSNEAQAPGPLFGRRDRSRGRGRVGRHPLDRVRRRVGAGRCWRTRRRRCSPRSRSRCWPSTPCRRGSTAGLLITVIALGRRSKVRRAPSKTISSSPARNSARASSSVTTVNIGVPS